MPGGPAHPPIGKSAPAFTLRDHDGKPVSLGDFRGRPVVLYWYPKDDTPGCTKQACELRDTFPRFRKSGAAILGASTDSVESHAKFRKKYDLPFTLLSDPDHVVAEQYGVWQQKKTFGVSYTGTARTTFVIDAKGVLRHVIPVKRVAGHADTVEAALAELGD
jgi:peroxiredoxin Q/BCP